VNDTGRQTAQPTFYDAVSNMIRVAKGAMHTCVPATIMDYDAALGSCSVQIATQFLRHDPATDALVPYTVAPLSNVPVAWLNNAGNSITFPLTLGDAGVLFIAERSLDTWKSTGNAICTPQDPRRFDLMDAFFVPFNTSLAPSRAVPATGVDAIAMVVRADQIKLGDNTAVEPLLLSATFETDLGTFLTALDNLMSAATIWLTVMATPDAPIAYVTALTGATTTFLTAFSTFYDALATFEGQVSGGTHRSTRNFTL